MVAGDKVRLNHELLLWVGFTRHGRIWTYPDGVDVDNGTPYFPEDIKACFKHLVPKYIDEIKAGMSANYIGNAYARLFERWQKELFFNDWKEPTLALCLAIQKLIRSK